MWGTSEQEREFAAIHGLWHGPPGVRDRRAAVQRLTPLAEAGYAPAQHALGMACFDGQGTARDLLAARAWFERAAQRSYAGAEGMLGAMFAAAAPPEAVTTHDPAAAARWFERAARHGNAAAMFNLATALRDGLGVAADVLEACAWASLAVRASSLRFRPAQSLRDALWAALDAPGRAEVERRVGQRLELLAQPDPEPLLHWRALAERIQDLPTDPGTPSPEAFRKR